MKNWRVVRIATLQLGLAVLGASTAAAQLSADVLRPHARQWEQLIAAEDARARSPEQLQVLLEGTRAGSMELRRLAVRALGRLERPELADPITAMLRDAAPGVRAEAAHALGQAVMRGDGAPVRPALASALASERDPSVRAAIAETLGRTRHASATDARATIDLLLPLLDESPMTALGATRGMFFLARQPTARSAFDATTQAALLRKATERTARANDLQSVRLRTVAAATLVTTGRANVAALTGILDDADPYVRREAAVALAASSDTSSTAPLIMRALSDGSGVVRLEGLRAYGRRLAGTRGCDPITRAVGDANPHVALLALDLLGTACPSTPAHVSLLDSIARALPTGSVGRWQHAAHAFTALAARAAERARTRLPAFISHPRFFVRTYAAVAATTLQDRAALIRLSNDAHPNVRTAAVDGLRRVSGRAADSVYLAQLTQDDSQLLQSAAAALDSTSWPSTANALLAALDRVSQTRRETSRDARVALLHSIRQLGNASLSARLQPYLRDFDPVVADSAARVLLAWTGSRPEVARVQPPAVPLPTFEQAAELAHGRAIIQLEDGGEIELQLLPFDAPTNAARFARLARAGYFDGLTFHRIAANFVVQGGSPNANEYTGDGPYTRDELAVENWRGTVGLSTRGRDTGDAQIYINLIDNVRLDHDYTIFARVLRGIELADRMLEGALMRRVMIR
ncbi:MAG: HEAT repeat domain-containing protein [Longimicrobiales bacterium]